MVATPASSVVSASASSTKPGGGTFKGRKFKPSALASPSPNSKTGPNTEGKTPKAPLTTDSNKEAPSSQHKGRKHLNLAAVQLALAENEDGVETMKREVSEFQETELSAAHSELVNLRKVHDKLYLDADQADLTHKAVCEELSQLERLAGVGNKAAAAGSPMELVNKLNARLSDTQRKLKISTEQKLVFGHMIERLKGELLSLQKDDNKLKQKVAMQQHELTSSSLQKQQAEIELKQEEDKLEDLLERLEHKRGSHEQRISGIKQIIEERAELLHRQHERNKKKEEILTKADMGQDEEQKLKRMNVIRQLYTTILEKKMSDDEEHLSSLENTFHRLRNVTGLSNVEEVVEKFLTRTTKNAQLQATADELLKKIESLKVENKKSRRQLEETIQRTVGNAGNREVYQEVDLIDNAVGSAVKQCEDSKQRATKLSVTIGELRETVARFLSKIQNKIVPVPSVKNLGESIHLLDADLTEMMKAVAANLTMKDDDDITVESPQKGNDGNQSFSKMAGNNLGKIMYHKMMTTEPDQSPRNVRVHTKLNMVQLGKHAQITLLDPSFMNDNPPPSAQHFMPNSRLLHDVHDDEQATVVDRDTVKKLAKLVVTQDETEKRKAKKKKSENEEEW
ncbi:hypothetical protein TrVE_jg11067 [Triparma verrucosa]|uniref:ODAD1 central coiled coil region domain-containing protein n=1 Tax=Triparma verrucosa TaxID=1606542 RepID=A0A9W7EYT0_9STRA|nr:hypothetical protein TrVE_jg11067 [Triparma verrucosa]